MIQIIDVLNRYKTAGADGLDNAFAIAQAVIEPATVAIGNERLTVGDSHKSFLQRLIFLLRKKGGRSNTNGDASNEYWRRLLGIAARLCP